MSFFGSLINKWTSAFDYFILELVNNDNNDSAERAVSFSAKVFSSNDFFRVMFCIKGCFGFVR